MSAIFQFVLRHGYSLFFAVLFARQIGLPLPGPPFLMAAGALAAAGKLNVFAAMGVAITACGHQSTKLQGRSSPPWRPGKPG